MTCVSMGNPHAVTFGPADSPVRVGSLPLAQLGPHFETHPVFPAKTNTEFVEVRIFCHQHNWLDHGEGANMVLGEWRVGRATIDRGQSNELQLLVVGIFVLAPSGLSSLGLD